MPACYDAMAMSCEPELLIADEPTTALDVTIQAQILELMEDIRAKKNTGILMITHDLGVVAEMCSRVVVMYAGRIVEEAPVQELFADPKHPYTQADWFCTETWKWCGISSVHSGKRTGSVRNAERM